MDIRGLDENAPFNPEDLFSAPVVFASHDRVKCDAFIAGYDLATETARGRALRA